MSTQNLGICAGLALMLAACATTTETVVVDSFCLSPASQKKIWNPDTDSVESMSQAVTHNRYVDLRCGVPGKA